MNREEGRIELGPLTVHLPDVSFSTFRVMHDLAELFGVEFNPDAEDMLVLRVRHVRERARRLFARRDLCGRRTVVGDACAAAGGLGVPVHVDVVGEALAGGLHLVEPPGKEIAVRLRGSVLQRDIPLPAWLTGLTTIAFGRKAPLPAAEHPVRHASGG
jgi:hypothetical protein